MTISGRTPGARDASALVFVHGDFGDGYESWGPTCNQIGLRYRTVIVDRPGFGVPLGSDDRFSVAGEARFVLDAAADMGIPSFHLVGHSYGALIAIEMAIKRPDAVRSLHLIEPPLLDLLPDQPLVQEMDQRVRTIVEQHAQIGDEATTEAFLAMIGAERAIERRRGTPDWERLCGHAARFARGEPAGDYPGSALARLQAAIPVALYTGGRSHPALRLIATELADRIVGASILQVPEAGHGVQISGAVFVNALLTFVQQADLTWAERVSVTNAEPARE